MELANATPPPGIDDDLTAAKATVLVIEDERTQRMTLRAGLERDGFQVFEAEDGDVGVNAFAANRPDLVLLDVRMPRMDGFATCKALRKLPGGERVPILMLTVLNDNESINQAYEAGATDFVTKPLVWPLLGHRLRYMLRARDAFRELADSEMKLARRVTERTSELEAANRELEAFNYSLSHDLGAPLRAIIGFASHLGTSELANLTAGGQEILKRVIGSANKMERLITDMLEFSRVGRAALADTTVDMRSLAIDVLEDLRETHPAVEASIDVLPPARGDPAMLRQVFANLLGNALKYSSRTAQPCIEVGALSSRNPAVYFVRDNGAGFDGKYAGELFKLFRRLHPESEFPGTGVGLMIVKRIVERHGGRVWAEGSVGRGATFYFTIGDSR
jgi:two-component system, sensor histidine kinase and response regulator